jgi:hypothetical protein
MAGLRKFVIVLLGAVCLIAQTAYADDDDDDSSKKDDQTLAQQTEDRFPQPIAAGALVNRRVIQPLESQPTLGRVRALVRAPDKTIEVVVDYGGFFGFGSRPIAVPLDAMTLLSPQLEIVAYTPAQLDGFPTFSGEGTTPLPLDEVVQIGLSKPSH